MTLATDRKLMYSTVTYTKTDEGLRETHAGITGDDIRYRVDVSTDNGKTWATNGLRWADAKNAATWGRDLSLRWFATTNIRVVDVATDETVEVVL